MIPALLVLVKGLFKMYKLSWIRWITHDIYTLDLSSPHFPPPPLADNR